MNTEKVILVIMDGWGLAENDSVSAIAAAKTPFYDKALANFPYTRLAASELAVGLPEGQMGNSEVGHMNIGAGRVVFQDLVRINNELENGGFATNSAFQEMVSYCKTNNKPLHLMGLLSDGGVHSTIHQLKGIIRLLAQEGLSQVFLHCFMDGRDTSPTGGKGYIEDLEACLQEHKTGKVASIIGRYYAMDRDKRWERVKKAYDLMVHGKGTPTTSAADSLQQSYDNGKTDEFIDPFVLVEGDKPVATLNEGDAVLFYNFRTDRGRELTHVLTQQDMPEAEMKTIPLYFNTLTRYDDSFKGIHVLYEKEKLVNGLGEYLANQGKAQIRIAETEKYPHVTFFFNGGREVPMRGERHLLCASPKDVATYDLRPEMSAGEIRDKIIAEIKTGEADFICLNFANPDMVGHTGVFEAAVKACEFVDQCTEAVVTAANENGYIALITADHGNADKLKNSDGSPHTAHTTALVPLFLVDPEKRYALKQSVGKLGDLAPTILTLMGMEIPEEMTGNVIIDEI